MELLVLSWFILTETNSPFQLALVMVFLNLPRPLLSMFTGAMADRFSRHHILLLAQSLNVLVAIGILMLFVSDWIEPLHVFTATFLQGTAWSLEHPSRRTAIFDIAGRGHLVNAMSLEMMSNTVGKMSGPLMAGLLIAVLGITEAYGFVLMAHILALGLLVPLKIARSRGNTRPESVWSSLLVTIKFALHSPMILGLLYVTIVMNALASPVQQFIPLIGRDHLGVGPALVGLLVAAEGFGQLASAGVIASMRTHQYHGRVFIVGTLTTLMMALLFVWSPWYALAFFILIISGMGQAGFGTMQSSIAMLWSPLEMRGRMIGLVGLCIGIGTPLGTLEIGAVATISSAKWAISSNALAGLLLLLPVLVLTPLVRRPSGAPQPETAQG